MQEEEYYILTHHLECLELRVPQSGIKFKYGKFFVESTTDVYGKEVYSIRKDNFSFLNNSLHLYPHRDRHFGFSIRDLDMSFETIMQFIEDIQKRSLDLSEKVYVRKTFVKELLYTAKERCPICLEDYRSAQDIHLFLCGYHSAHQICAEKYEDTKCLICRK